MIADERRIASLVISDGEVRVVIGYDSPTTLLEFDLPVDLEMTITSPDPHMGTVWVAKSQERWLVALDQLSLARRLRALEGGIDSIIDASALAGLLDLGQAPLIASLLNQACALPPQARMRLTHRDGHPSDCLVDSLIEPLPTSKQELLDFLVSQYEVELADHDTALCLVSGGWDSRLELALVRQALGRRGRVIALHLATTAEESSIAAEVASLSGAEFSAIPIDECAQAGFAAEWIRRKTATLPTWRPTIPAYAYAASTIMESLRIDRFFGFTPWTLKGRDYKEPIPGDVPRSAHRIRCVGLEFADVIGADAQSVWDLQNASWRALNQVSQDWDRCAARDYLNWAAYYRAYAHRVQILQDYGQTTLTARSDVVSRFMGLNANEKADTSFVEFALGVLDSRLLDRAIFASSGDLSRTVSTRGYVKRPMRNLTASNPTFQQYFVTGADHPSHPRSIIEERLSRVHPLRDRQHVNLTQLRRFIQLLRKHDPNIQQGARQG